MYEKLSAECLVHSACLKMIAFAISENTHFWLETFLNPSRRISHLLGSGSLMSHIFQRTQNIQESLAGSKPVLPTVKYSEGRIFPEITSNWHKGKCSVTEE